MAASRCGLTPVLSCRASEVYQLLTRAAVQPALKRFPLVRTQWPLVSKFRCCDQLVSAPDARRTVRTHISSCISEVNDCTVVIPQHLRVL